MAFQAIRSQATSRLFRGTRQLHFLTSKTRKRLGNGQEVVFQNVKVTKGKYGTWMGRTAFGIFAAVTAINTYSYLVLSPLEKAAEDLAQIEQHEHEDEEDSALFIPIPLTTKEVMPPPYSRKDPEWAEFIKISKDKDLIGHIRKRLLFHVLSAAREHRLVAARFGKPFRVSSWHLDLEYPLYPPPVHQQLGLLITDEVVAIARRERESQAARLEERVLWPKPMIMGTWAVLSFVVSDLKNSVLGALFDGDGQRVPDQAALESDPTPAIASATAKPSDVQKTIQAIREQTTTRPGEVPPPDTNMAASGDKAPQKAAPRVPVNGSIRPPAHSSPTASEDKGNEALVPLSQHWKTFWEAHNSVSTQLRATPPRGSVPVMGLVVIETPKAWLYVDVIGWWDPKEQDYHKDSTYMGLSRYRSKVVSPLR